MTLEEFQDQLRTEFKRDFSEGRNDSSSMLMWFMESIFCLDRIQAIDCICDSKNDKGIDGIYVDDKEDEIHIFQAKYKEANNTVFGDKVLRDFSGVKCWFSGSKSIDQLLGSSISDELKNLVLSTSLKDCIDEYKVHYHFVSNAKKDHNSIEYEAANDDLTVWDIDMMFKNYKYISEEPLVLGEITFKDIKSDQVIKMNSVGESNSMIVFPINAKELLKLSGIDDYSLFNKNVRYGLGNTRVNNSIRDTLKNEKEKDKFIIFHNGITLVCENFLHNTETNEVKIKNYSIVNGAQSTLAFYKHERYIDDNTNVFLKVVNTGGNPLLMNQITYYNNNQNSITMKDLRSNDNVQRRIEREFEELHSSFGLKYIYVPKKGKIIEKDFLAIESDYAAQLITACYLKNSYNTHLKTSMFTSTYNDIFNRNINAKKIFLYSLAHETLREHLGEFEDKTIASYGLFQYFVLSLVFDIIEKNSESKVVFDRIDNYISNPIIIKRFFNKVFGVFYKIIDQHIIEEKEKGNFDYKNFFKAKNTVVDFKRRIETSFTTILRMTKLSFAQLCEDLNG